MNRHPIASGQATILITSYNQSDFLADAIATAQSQTVPCRVAMVDDGSTDGSAEIGKMAGLDVLELDHVGAVEAFRTGIAQIETPYYCLLNGDDMLQPNFIEQTMPLMLDPKVGFVYTGAELFGAESGTRPALPFKTGRLLWGNYVLGTSLTRLAAYESVGGFDQKFGDALEDWALWVALVADGWTGAALDLPLVRYRRHRGPSRNRYPYRHGQLVRWRLMRKHPKMYLRHGFGVMAAAVRALTLRLHRKS